MKHKIITLLLLSMLIGCNDDGSPSGARPIDPIGDPMANTTLPDGNTTMADVVDTDNNGLIGISTLEDLYSIRDNLTGDYGLMNNLDFNNASSYASGAINTNWTTGEGWPGIGSCTTNNNCNPFSGEFEGNGFTITNLFINASSTTNGTGLFAAANGRISNLRVINASVSGGSTDIGVLIGYGRNSDIRNVGINGMVDSPGGIVGGLIGHGQDADVNNSYATATVRGTTVIGGLIGNGINANVENSYAIANVSGIDNVGGLIGFGNLANVDNSYATGSVSGTGEDVGGLIGDGQAATVTNSYATGNVSGTSSFVGGLLGQGQSAIVENSYAAGSVSGDIYVGGLIGIGTLATVMASYWDTDTTGQTSSSGGGEGKTTSELQSPTNSTGIYEDWDDDLWDFGDATQYPMLR